MSEYISDPHNRMHFYTTISRLTCLTLSFLAIISNSCTSNHNAYSVKDENGKFVNYITLNGNKFMDGDATFYPMVLNYSVDVARSDEGSMGLHITPRAEYHPDFGEGNGQSLSPWPGDSAISHGIIQSHFTAIKDMGFNCIRLTGFTATDFYDQGTGFHTWSMLDLSDTEPGNRNITKKLIPLLRTILSYAEREGLRVILLISAVERQPDYQLNLYSKLAEGLANEKTLLAYDLYNEPIYSDKGDYSKEETTEFVRNYNKAIKRFAPNHLTTIGLCHYKIVHEWDPVLMDVDFHAFHVYPYGSINLSKLERFEAKLYWISRNIEKPWILGETGLNTAEGCEPLNWSWGTIEDQRKFMSYSLKEARAAGASGYGWWSFQDMKFKPGVTEGTCATSCYGLVNHKPGNYFINSAGDSILGGMKTPVDELPFRDFVSNDPYPDSFGSYPMPDESVYYNIDYLPENEFFTGRVVDENGHGIVDAIVSLRNPISKAVYTTFSKSDGNFNIKTGYTNVLAHPDFELRVTAVRRSTEVMKIREIYKGEGRAVENVVLKKVNF